MQAVVFFVHELYIQRYTKNFAQSGQNTDF
jgi:hypothetical protein